MYVKAKDKERGTVTLAKNDELFSNECTLRELTFTYPRTLDVPLRAAVKTRYNAREVAAIITPMEGGRAHVRFDAPVRAITPGQAAVFYDGDVVLGGGIIEA